MSKKNWNNILSVLARTVLAFVFVFGQTAWAIQSRNVSDKPTSNAVVKPPQTPPSPNTAGSKAQPQAAGERTSTAQNLSAEGRSERSGQREGITVHGHWSIEVHNPDGSLVRHVEFENSLDPGFTVPGNPPAAIPGGAAYLSAVLTGQWASPGLYNTTAEWPNWFIFLAGSGLNNITTTTASPCMPPGGSYNACLIGQTITTGGGSGCAQVPGESCNLSVLPLGTAPNFTGIQLTGSVTATQNGQVSTVATLLAAVSCLLSASAATCPVGLLPIVSFTSSANFPGAPINVVAGQTIAVTVNISFS